ncbi:HAAS domain-containing protein [Alkalibacillus sp. S2W]|uniref:HAAS domain-containing protein n=1 Tax=Alkalibacillus sp. S2W TaxID=3386553 RepID=UPI00398CC029
MISKEGERFIEKMRSYLISKGKTDAEIEGLLETAKVHLIEGEKDGKSVEDILGKSPETYAKALDSVMTVSTKEDTKHLINFIIVIFSLVFINNLLNDPLNVSLLELIGFPSMFILWIVVTILGLRVDLSELNIKNWVSLFLLAMVPSSVTVGVLYFRSFYDPTIFTLDGAPRYILAAIVAIPMLISVFSLIKYYRSLNLTIKKRS